jgi:hypothetical protein
MVAYLARGGKLPAMRGARLRNDGLDPPIAHTAMIAYCQCFARRVKQISLKTKMCNAAKGAATVHGVVFEILA